MDRTFKHKRESMRCQNDGTTKSGMEKVVMWKNGYPVSEIQERLSKGVSVSRVSLFALIKFMKTKLAIDLKES